MNVTEICVPRFAPPLGKTWGVLVYPGGRCEVKPYAPEELEPDIDEAAHRLRLGIAVRVKPEDFVATVEAWAEAEEQALARIEKERQDAIQSAWESFGRVGDQFGGSANAG